MGLSQPSFDLQLVVDRLPPVSSFLRVERLRANAASAQQNKPSSESSPSYLPGTPRARVSAAAGAHVGPDAPAAVETLLLAVSWRTHQSIRERPHGSALANSADTHGSGRASPATRGRSGRRWPRRTRLRSDTSADSWLGDENRTKGQRSRRRRGHEDPLGRLHDRRGRP